MLHSIAAHLHRYSSELDSLSYILEDIVCHRKALEINRRTSPVDEANFMQICRSFAQLASHLRQAKSFVQELEQKLQNILALVRTFIPSPRGQKGKLTQIELS